MKIFKLVLKWIACLLFILMGITNCLGKFVDSLLMIEDLYLSDVLKISGIGFIIVGFIISPLFERIEKKISKNFSGLRKFILSFGIIFISVICSLIFSELYNKSIVGLIWSIILTILFILFYFYIMCVTNKHKYEDNVKNKWYIILLVIFLLLCIPYFMIKGLIVNNYNSMMKRLDIQFLETKKIESIELQEKDYYLFENLKVRNDFKEYEISYEQKEPYKSITFVDRDNDKLKGVALTNFDYFKEFYDDALVVSKNNVLSKIHPYAKFILSNDISSEQNYYKYLKENKKLSIFDSIGEIYTSWLFANISLSSISSFQIIENSNYDISIMTGQLSDNGSVKMIEIIDNEDVYTITLFTTNKYSDEEIYSFISSIKID